MPTEKKDIESGETESKKGQESLKEKNDMQPEAALREQKPEKESQSEGKPSDKPAQAESTEKIKKEIEAKTEKVPESGKKETEPEEKTQETEKPGFPKLDEYAGVRKDLPEIKIGDVVKVSYRVIEGGKERIQMFEGIVIARKNSGISRTITVRKTSFGVAVERIFPLNSKLIQKIQVKKHSKVRRAKLYYLRELKGKAARLKELR